MLFDPLYFVLVGPAMLLAMYANSRVKGAFARWHQVANGRRLTGEQVALALIKSSGLRDVRLTSTAPDNDHYDPRDRSLALSPAVGNASSVAAMAVAAHEIGHALQDSEAFAPLRMRTAYVPVSNYGSQLGTYMLIGGMLLAGFGSESLGLPVAWLGLAVFALGSVVSLVTLPVEFDASRRALAVLANSGLVAKDEEQAGVKAALNAPALTYVAAAGAAIATVAYYGFRLMRMYGRRE
jgi:Zn-dependent membrane protease YugP